jgi:hypothetical protein
MHEDMNGSAASAARAGFRALAKDAYSKALESWISSTVRGAKISKLDFQAGTADGWPSIDVEFSASRYGQRMPGILLVLNPTIVSRRDSINLMEPTRKLPIVTESEAFSEILRLKLPEGFTIDEMPAPVNLKTAFGSYRADCSA